MNNTVRLNAGERILVEIPGDEYRSYWEFTYDELVDILSKRPKSHASRRSKTPESKASRKVSLLTRAITTGQWSTGALINRTSCAQSLASLLKETPYDSLSPKARSKIADMIDSVHDNPKLHGLLECFDGLLPDEV